MRYLDEPESLDQVRELAAAEGEIAELKFEREELLRELASAESVVESQQRTMIAAGILDPELG